MNPAGRSVRIGRSVYANRSWLRSTVPSIQSFVQCYGSSFLFHLRITGRGSPISQTPHTTDRLAVVPSAYSLHFSDPVPTGLAEVRRTDWLQQSVDPVSAGVLPVIRADRLLLNQDEPSDVVPAPVQPSSIAVRFSISVFRSFCKSFWSVSIC